MERIRKALDLARLERDGARAPGAALAPPGVGVPPSIEQPTAPEPVRDSRDARGATEAANAAALAIIYTQTRVFKPDPLSLERNRIFAPAATAPAATAFRMLRTQVMQRMDAHGWRSIAVFSPNANDGKTTTAINLAASLAGDRLHTVLLVELDFTHPTIAKRFGLANEFGSDDAMMGAAKIEDCLYHPEGFDRLVLLPARDTLVNSSEILAGPRSRQLIAELRARYPERILVFDLPPVLSADDALAFAPQVDCGLIVAAEGRTRRNNLVRTVELLAKVPLVGTVLNRAADVPSGY